MTLHQLLDLGENILDKFKKCFPFNHLEVLLVDALPGVVEGKGDTHPAVEEDELEEEKDGEDRVLELAWVLVKYEKQEKIDPLATHRLCGSTPAPQRGQRQSMHRQQKSQPANGIKIRLGLTHNSVLVIFAFWSH